MMSPRVRIGLFGASLLLALDAAPVPAAQVRLSAALGNETLQLVEDAPGINRVLVNGTTVFEDRSSRSIALVNAVQVQGRWLVILRHEGGGQDKGRDGCAAQYRVLDLAALKPAVSLPFGTCGEAVELATPGDVLTVSMPTPDGKATASWTYKDGRIARTR